MIQLNTLLLARLATASVVLAGLMMAPRAGAQKHDQAAMDAYNSNYLETSGGNTYYTGSLKSDGTSASGEWVQAVEIYVAEDRYEYTRAASDRSTVIALLNSLESMNSTWQSDGWDDNLAWMAVAFMRGYKLTGEAEFLTQAEGGSIPRGIRDGIQTWAAAYWRNKMGRRSALSVIIHSSSKVSIYIRRQEILLT